MNCFFITYNGEDIVDVTKVLIPNYDGDPYGDTVPFTVQSNQSIILFDDAPGDIRVLEDEARCIDTRLGNAEATTAAMAALDAAREVLGNDPHQGGCKAFYTTNDFGALGYKCDMKGVHCVIMCDGGDFAPMLNTAYENYTLMCDFREAMMRRGYQCARITHFAFSVQPRDKTADERIAELKEQDRE